MSYDMIMKLPIQERRAMIHRHNMEQDAINREAEGASSSNIRKYEGETINKFAEMEQSNKRRG